MKYEFVYLGSMRPPHHNAHTHTRLQTSIKVGTNANEYQGGTCFKLGNLFMFSLWMNAAT
jgi:hypothetical protein